jgi:hypothetical protein
LYFNIQNAMKHILLGSALVFSILLSKAQTWTFKCNDSIQHLVIPNNVYGVSISAKGASGRDVKNHGLKTSSVAGKGATAMGNLAVTPGDTLWVFVGDTCTSTKGLGGWNGGGNGGFGTAGGSFTAIY